MSYSGGGGHILKWRGCILRSGGAVICKVEGVSKWWGVFYILQGTCYIWTVASVGRAFIELAELSCPAVQGSEVLITSSCAQCLQLVRIRPYLYRIYVHCTDIRKLRFIIRKTSSRRVHRCTLAKETTRDLSRVVLVQQLQYVRWCQWWWYAGTSKWERRECLYAHHSFWKLCSLLVVFYI